MKEETYNLSDKIIANRTFSLIDKNDSKIRDVKLTIYKPIEQSTNEWLCSYQITEINNNALYSILGVDALQSLQLALNIIEGLLKDYNQDNEQQIIWIEKNFDLIK